MNRIYSLAAPAALVLWSVGSAYGAPKAQAESPSAEAKAIFAEIEAVSATISDDAFSLSEMATDGGMDRGPHSEGLNRVKENVNKVGRDIQSLEAERDSLPAWEITALDQIVPLMHEVAENTQEAIKTFVPEIAGPAARSYAGETGRIAKYADEVTILLRNRLKLEKTREKELQLEHRLGEASGS